MKLSPLFSALALAIFAVDASATTFVSSLGSGATSNGMGYGTKFATLFSTGSTYSYTYDLDSVSMYLECSSGSVTYTLSIYSSSGSSYGSLLYTATTVTLTSTGSTELVTFNFTGTDTLDSNTSYYLYLTSTGSDCYYMYGESASGTYGWSVGSSILIFTGWSATGMDSPQLSISGTIVPEPATSAALLGLGVIGMACARKLAKARKA